MSDDLECSLDYVEARDAFFDQPLQSFVIDEVKSMLRIFFIQTPCCNSFYNPIYVVLFVVLYVLTLPGAVLHWLVICYVPVRAYEDMDEREFRCQGIYTAIGTALLSMTYSAIAVYRYSEANDAALIAIHTVTVYVDVGLVLFCLIGLKGITDELGTTVRVFIIGAWVIDLVLVGLLLCDIPLLPQLATEAMLGFALKVITVFVSTVVATESLHFWSLYEMRRSRKARVDLCLASTLLLLTVGDVGGLVAAIWLTWQSRWAIGA